MKRLQKLNVPEFKVDLGGYQFSFTKVKEDEQMLYFEAILNCTNKLALLQLGQAFGLSIIYSCFFSMNKDENILELRFMKNQKVVDNPFLKASTS